MILLAGTAYFEFYAFFCFGLPFIQWIHTFYKNVSSRVLNNGFANSSFAVERQGDPLSAYLFIIALEILCVTNIRSSSDIRGIKFDNEEIKVSSQMT